LAVEKTLQGTKQMMLDWTWLLLAYIAGSVVTGFMVWKSNSIDAINLTIDKLIEEGYLRVRKGANGDVEILKINQE
jgi:hypothetical protein